MVSVFGGSGVGVFGFGFRFWDLGFEVWCLGYGALESVGDDTSPGFWVVVVEPLSNVGFKVRG